MGRDGAGIALEIAELVLRIVQEVCFGIELAIEEGDRVGGWSSSRGVMIVEAEDLVAGLAVGMRVFGQPMSTSIRSALVQEEVKVGYTCSGSACLTSKASVLDILK